MHRTEAAKQHGNSCRHPRLECKRHVLESLPAITTTMRLLFAILVGTLLALPAWARQDPQPVRRAVEDFLRIQTKGLPGRVQFAVGNFDPNNSLPSCGVLEVGLPPGARLWGRTSVAVRCAQEGGWTVFVSAQVRVLAEYLVTSRPLAQGQVVADGDFSRQIGDLTDLPSGILTDPGQAIGRTIVRSIPAGQPLRSDLLRQSMVIKQGQSVKVISKGPGFQVANEGRALNNGADGQVVQVRLNNGQVVSGIARNGGYVEISY